MSCGVLRHVGFPWQSVGNILVKYPLWQVASKGGRRWGARKAEVPRSLGSNSPVVGVRVDRLTIFHCNFLEASWIQSIEDSSYSRIIAHRTAQLFCLGTKQFLNEG